MVRQEDARGDRIRGREEGGEGEGEDRGKVWGGMGGETSRCVGGGEEGGGTVGVWEAQVQ